MRKPYATDWKPVYGNDSVEYSQELRLYWKDGKVYDQLSASHNGIIGLGQRLRDLIRRHDETNRNTNDRRR